MQTVNEQVFDLLYNSKLTWTTNKEQLYTQDGTTATGAYATRRSDNAEILGIVGSRYMPLQNQDLAREFIEASQGFNFKKIEALAVGNGKKVIIKAYIGDVIVGKDTIHRYITVSNTHDGSAPVRLGIFNKVLVCQNGLMREINSSELARVKHTTNAAEKMNWYIRNIPKVLAAEEEMIKTYQSLAEVKINSAHIEQLIKSVYKVDASLPEDQIATKTANRIKEFDAALTNNGLNVHGNTLWGALQAMTYLTSHDKTGVVTNDYLEGAKYEIGNMTYDMLVNMINNPIYEEVEA
jgi:Domain of unknown function (DUF932)